MSLPTLLAGLLPLSFAIAQQPAPATFVRPAVASPASALPVPLVSFGCAALGEAVFVYGGHTGKAHAHSRDNQQGALLRLDRRASAPQWLEIATGPALQSPALVAYDQGVIRLGGMMARNRSGEPEDLWSVAEVARFDLAQGSWTALPSLPEARSSHDAIVVGSRILVVGGWQLAGNERHWLDTAWSLDLAVPGAAWQPLPAPPFHRRALAIVAQDERLHAIGGLDADGEMSQQVDVLDLKAGTWSRGPDFPGQGFAAAAVAQEGHCYASGRDGVLYRLAGDHWDAVTNLALPRFFHRLVPAGEGQLLAIGGASDRHLATCELLPTQRTTLHVQQWSLPCSHPARNRQGFAVHGDTLFVMGGNRGAKQHDFEPEHFVAETCAIDLRTMQATARAAMPAARQSFGALPAGDRLLALGGFGYENGGGRSQPSFTSYVPKADAWHQGPSLPEPRTQFGFVHTAENFWVLGGIDYAPDRKGNEFVFVDSVLRWDGADGVFEPVAKLPQPRRAFGCAAMAGRIWLVGGMKEGFEPVPEVDTFELATKTWSMGPRPTATRVSPFLVSLDGALVLAGGSMATDDGLQPARTIEVLAEGATTWSSFDLPIEPPLLGAVRWRGQLLAISRSGENLLLTCVHLPGQGQRP